MKKKELTFEEALAKLEKSAGDIEKENITLHEAIEVFKEGIENYKKCSEILENAKQEIEVYKRS